MKKDLTALCGQIHYWTTIISGNKFSFILICLQYLMGDGGEMFPCRRGIAPLSEGKSFPLEGGSFPCLRVKWAYVGRGKISLLEGIGKRFPVGEGVNFNDSLFSDSNFRSFF